MTFSNAITPLRGQFLDVLGLVTAAGALASASNAKTKPSQERLVEFSHLFDLWFLSSSKNSGLSEGRLLYAFILSTDTALASTSVVASTRSPSVIVKLNDQITASPAIDPDRLSRRSHAEKLVTVITVAPISSRRIPSHLPGKKGGEHTHIL